MNRFDAFRAALHDGVKTLAREAGAGLEDAAREDADAFVRGIRSDLRRWTGLLAARELTEPDFRDLVRAKKALAEMHALRQAGIALTRVERLRTGLVELVIDTAFDTFT